MSEDLEAAFIFVPHGDPLPLDWMRRHPGWIKIPALFVPHDTSESVRRKAVAAFTRGAGWDDGGSEETQWGPATLEVADQKSERSSSPENHAYGGVEVLYPNGHPIPDHSTRKRICELRFRPWTKWPNRAVTLVDSMHSYGAIPRQQWVRQPTSPIDFFETWQPEDTMTIKDAEASLRILFNFRNFETSQTSTLVCIANRPG